jgi:CBS domain-containing protein
MATEWPTAGEMMTTDTVRADADEPLSAVVGAMRARDIHEVPVLRRGKLVGMVLLEALARRPILPISAKAEHVMVVPPTLSPGDPLPVVAQRLLETGRRAACVVDPRSGRLLGIVSRADLVRASVKVKVLADTPVLPVATPPTRSLREGDSLRSLMADLRPLEESALPVLDKNGRLQGALALRDVVAAFWRPVRPGKRDAAGRERPTDPTAGSLMSRPAVSVPRESTVGEACRAMARQSLTSVFVEDGEGLLAVFSEGDLLRLAQRQQPGEGVYVEVTGFPPGTDPRLLSDLDRVISRGLHRVGRLLEVRTLSVHVTPRGEKRTGQVTVGLRAHADRDSLWVERSDWDVLRAATLGLEELERQARELKETRQDLRREATSSRVLPPTSIELTGEPELELKLDRSLPETPRRRRR